MNKASRLMPKYSRAEESFSFVAWGFSAIVVAVLVWVVWDNPVLLVLVPIIAIGSYIAGKRQKKKLDALAKERIELSICEFARSFDCREVDTWVIRAVYEQIQEYVSCENILLPIKAEDDLFDVLDIDSDDLDLDILEEIAQRTGRSIENTDKNPYYGKVSTVRDLVYFINEQPIAKST